jgi:hypothetical protein
MKADATGSQAGMRVLVSHFSIIMSMVMSGMLGCTSNMTSTSGTGSTEAGDGMSITFPGQAVPVKAYEVKLRVEDHFLP